MTIIFVFFHQLTTLFPSLLPSPLQGAVEDAFADGFNLVEVEFPPLQQDYLEDSGSSAYDVSSANVRLASRFAQSFAAEGKVIKSLLDTVLRR